MGKVISFANQKGGVGKTTSVFNIGMTLARKKKKTLIVDLDSQASLTISAGLEPDYEYSIVSAMQRNGVKLSSCIHELQKNFDIVTSRLELAQIEFEMVMRSMRETILKKAIEPIKNDYDYILIDCPPQLSILTLNALVASDYVIIPVKTDYLAYRGVELLMETISEIQEEMNPELKVLGVVATLFEMRVKANNKILELLKERHEVIAVIKKLAIAEKGVLEGLSVMDISPSSEVATAYEQVAEYLIKRG